MAELGLRVIPLKPRSKAPGIPEWQKKGTCDPGTIRGWFEADPDGNLGLLTGNGIVALDIDVGAGGNESFDQLTKELGDLPETAWALTGSGGRHFLFKVEAPLRNRVGIRAGIDLRAEGGQIVVAPSLHPDTGQAYTWARHPREGIADAPEWLWRLLTERDSAGRPSGAAREPGRSCKVAGAVARAEDPRSAKAGRRGSEPVRRRRAPPTCAGDRTILAEDVIERFPVTDFGRRHDRMTRAVGSLMGRGYAAKLVSVVMGDWYAHFLALGVIRTGPDEAEAELNACIFSTARGLERGGFQLAIGEQFHEAACRRIRPDADQRERLAWEVVADGRDGKTLKPISDDGRQAPGTPGEPYCKRVTPILKRLCESEDERAFVEALVVLTTYKMSGIGEEPWTGLVRMTHDQIRRIAADRREGLIWRPQQIERLKLKYVTRESDGKPATRFELFQEVRKGRRGRGGRAGSPSEYRPTGVRPLLDIIPQSGQARPEAE